MTPKSSTTKTKSIGREMCLKRQGVEVSKKPKEAKVREFARLLEAVHRLIDSKDDVGLAGGVSLDEG